MIKKLSLLLVAITALVWLNPVTAQNTPYTIIANPGENASREIRINWHTNLGSGDSHIIYTKRSDKNWKKAISARAEQEVCTVFDSIYSKKPNGDNFYEDARFIRNTIALQGLKEDTEYKYKFSANKNTEIHYFKTAPKSDKWTMGIISDMHVYTPLSNRQKVAMEMIQQLEKQNKKPFDMMLHVGDIAAWGGSYSFWPNLYADSTFSKYVWAGVNGNHDNMTRLNAQSNKFFRNVNNNPMNGYPGEIGVSYHFTYGDALFVMLNNEAMKSDEELAKAQDWTRDVIKSNPAKYIIFLSHYQWFMGNDGKGSQYSRWKKLFDEYGVDLAISGNNHIYVRTNALYGDQETDGSKGTVYIQTPSSDNERGRALDEQLYNKDLIKFRWSEGSKTVGALIMKANKKGLTLTLYNRDGNAIDHVSVKSKSKKLR
ncbi:MAG: metallophosphoesterase [Bacteroidia bacterium]